MTLVDKINNIFVYNFEDDYKNNLSFIQGDIKTILSHFSNTEKKKVEEFILYSCDSSSFSYCQYEFPTFMQQRKLFIAGIENEKDNYTIAYFRTVKFHLYSINTIVFISSFLVSFFCPIEIFTIFLWLTVIFYMNLVKILKPKSNCKKNGYICRAIVRRILQKEKPTIN